MTEHLPCLVLSMEGCRLLSGALDGWVFLKAEGATNKQSLCENMNMGPLVVNICPAAVTPWPQVQDCQLQ